VTDYTVSTVEDFRRRYEEGVEVLMPSGMVVKMRSIGLDTLLRNKKIPDSLMGVVLEALDVFSREEAREEAALDLEQRAMDFATLINDVVAECWITPPVATGKKDAGVQLEWIELRDKFFTLKMFNMPLVELSRLSFRLHAEFLEPVHAEPGDTPAP
jgi:hypothetical protein